MNSNPASSTKASTVMTQRQHLWKASVFAGAGLLFGIGSFYPDTLAFGFIGWITACALTVSVRMTRRICRDFFLFGFLFGFSAFYWLPDTLQFFGGFPTAVSYVLFVLFLAASSLQFVLCGWLYCKLKQTRLDAWGLSLALAWLSTEFLFPRLFPWYLAHSQINFFGVSNLAAIIGVAPVSAMMIWMTEMLLRVFRPFPERPKGNAFKLGIVFTLIVTLYVAGQFSERQTREQLKAQLPIKVALIQGNLSAKEKGDIRYFETNLETYRRLSLNAKAAGAQIVLWPESVMNIWTPEKIETLLHTRFHPYPELGLPLLFGALTYREREAREVPERVQEDDFFKFNSAFGIDSEGSVLGVYHKKILMPFGEYLPFADTFPKLKELSPYSGDFSKGDLHEPIEFVLNSAGNAPQHASIGALICYEDMIPTLTRDFVSRGANLFVNLTNDAWYGQTAAPYQHNLLAAWRAVETRRFLLRVTNTGFTTVVDPFGKSVHQLDIFTEGFVVAPVQLLDSKTLYSRIGDSASYGLVLIALVGLLSALVKKGR